MPVYVVFVSVGRATLRSVAAVRLAGSYSHLLFGEVIASHAALSGRAQVEAFLFLLSHAPVSLPHKLVWATQLLPRLLAKCAPGNVGSTTTATSWLAKQSILTQVKTIGIHGSAVSALSSTAVQLGFQGCVLLKRSLKGREVASQQFCYDAVTTLASGAASVVGGSCGAIIGALILPGVGTALGALVGSLGCSFVPYALRRDGPEDRRERMRQVSAECNNFGKTMDVIEDEEADWLLLVECEEDANAAFFDRMLGDDAEWLTELFFAAGDDGASCGLLEDTQSELQLLSTVTGDDDDEEEFVDFMDFGASKEVKAA
ncbi:hypothetical protein TraAM80_02393 [Trypanosoma rangeli]|uniref:Uncharacterized protein n=1 Tax=Trypanosoma rangeli TaxID=5698 RepID=A0A422NUK6_TRYRA|nr:uncharacterized protein TraAM80_02393 [Trypanosoma rangeli]RNF09134.1 hypothetical protein TraAM80_02393 [Trypanosoma rangeli]|eukprot:RNF09134.1 hypothetical protein TraAM80_02393 [Trypanosoma rangeli]